MIFSPPTKTFYDFESKKERNLYFKIFGGYLFNELVSNYEQRKIDFLELLKKSRNDSQRLTANENRCKEIFQFLRSEKWNVTFDFHTSQDDKYVEDRGEMSDILIWTKSSMLSIECKYLSDFNIKKDINDVHKRIKFFSDTHQKKAMQVLLIKKSKWNYSQVKKDITIDDHSIPIIVLFWEDFEKILNPNVQIFLKNQLERPRKKK